MSFKLLRNPPIKKAQTNLICSEAFDGPIHYKSVAYAYGRAIKLASYVSIYVELSDQETIA